MARPSFFVFLAFLTGAAEWRFLSRLFGQDSRPANFYRQVLLDEPASGTVSRKALRQFRDDSAIAALIVCTGDPDAKVRSQAALVLGEMDPRQERIDALRHLLHDAEPQVRLSAMVSLGKKRQFASSAFQELNQAVDKDPESQLRFTAEWSLWEIDPNAAAKSRHWQEFVSKKWGFRAIFPRKPNETTRTIDVNLGTAHVFQAQHGVSQLMVAVTELPPGVVYVPQAFKFKEAADLLCKMARGKVLSNRNCSTRQYVGREMLIDAPAFKGSNRVRICNTRNRPYMIIIAYNPDFLIPKAADYFFDSVQLMLRRSRRSQGYLTPLPADKKLLCECPLRSLAQIHAHQEFPISL